MNSPQEEEQQQLIIITTQEKNVHVSSIYLSGSLLLLFIKLETQKHTPPTAVLYIYSRDRSYLFFIYFGVNANSEKLKKRDVFYQIILVYTL